VGRSAATLAGFYCTEKKSGGRFYQGILSEFDLSTAERF
jgi:hypothetical protein